jgi:ADP-dependent NAD(P)H-hydrate dehydratase / NAD(P)H-hydrate epimerase
MKILSQDQIRQADKATMASVPISSIDLMEHAAKAFTVKLLGLTRKAAANIYSGTGNNGGDALAISRMLQLKGWKTEVYIVGNPENGSPDFKENLRRLPDYIPLTYVSKESDLPENNPEALIIDGLFGSGLSRPVEGLAAQVIDHINKSGREIYSIDIASGLRADEISSGAIIKPTHTISFQLPKLAFFIPQCHPYVRQWHVVPIGLDQNFIDQQPTPFNLTEETEMAPLLPVRSRFDHKGNAGKVLIMAGSKGKIGAAILAAKGAFRTGTGLLFAHLPGCGSLAMNTALPEAMMVEDPDAEVITTNSGDNSYNAMVAGPGLGTAPETAKALKAFIQSTSNPLVLDADALNLLAANKAWLDLLPPDSILTPHPGEFARLVGQASDDFHRLGLLREFCQRYHVNMVLKGAYSAVCDIHGNVFFNPTGNPGMATAGSGDVLSGIVVSLLGQGLKPFEALRLGVYLHGLAGDIALEKYNELSIQASDIVEAIPSAINRLTGDN